MRACDLPPNELENLAADRSSWRSSFEKQVSDFERRRIYCHFKTSVFNARPVVSYRQTADSPVTLAVVSVHQGSISSLTNELICHPEIRHVDGSVQPTSDCIFRSLRPYNLRSSVNSRWLILLTHTRAYNPHRSNVLSCALMVSLLWRSTSVTGNLF